MYKLFVCLCIVVLTVSVFAEEKVYENSPEKGKVMLSDKQDLRVFIGGNSLEKGKFALQFGISGSILANMKLAAFNGSTISGKYQFCKKNAMRVGLSLDYRNNEMNREDLLESQTINRNMTTLDMLLDIQFIHYFSQAENFHLFAGAGPTIGFENYTADYTYGDESDVIDKETKNEWIAGASIVCGTEWFIHKNVSLSVEYMSSARYEKAKLTDKRTGELSTSTRDYKHEESHFEFYANQIKLGISFYF